MKPYITIGQYFDKDKLLTIFYHFKDKKLQPYKTKGSTDSIKRGYWEMYFSYEDGKELFNTPPCRGYQFVYMPPNYKMVIHKDLSLIKCRIGSLLEGSGDILFYDDENNLTDRYDYKEDILTDVQIKHNVQNNNDWRLTFFANFEQDLEQVYNSL